MGHLDNDRRRSGEERSIRPTAESFSVPMLRANPRHIDQHQSSIPYSSYRAVADKLTYELESDLPCYDEIVGEINELYESPERQ